MTRKTRDAAMKAAGWALIAAICALVIWLSLDDARRCERARCPPGRVPRLVQGNDCACVTLGR